MKTNLKRTLSAILSTILLLNNTCTISAMATEYETDTSLDTLDTLIAAHIFMASDDPNENYWPDEVRIKRQIPLYSVSGEQVAWYLEFFSGEYAVINNDRNNPSAIEFGEGGNPLITSILDTDPNAHIIFENPSEVYSSLEISTFSLSSDLYYYYPDLIEPNPNLSQKLSDTRASIESIYETSNINRGGSWEFINWSDMPSGSYSSGVLGKVRTINWAIMDDFESIATNHCAATCVTNMMIWFGKNGFPNTYLTDNLTTFCAVHMLVGNGPDFSIKSEVEEYIENRTNYSVNYNTLGSFSSLKNAINNDRPCTLLLATTEWHWVLGIGWREYDNIIDGDYVQIVDGWNRTSQRFHKLYDDAANMSMSSFQLS